MAEAANRKHPRHQRTPQFDGVLDDAEHLLNYAVEAGIEVDPDVAKRILAAITVGHAAWDSAEAGELVAAITKLAAKLTRIMHHAGHFCRVRHMAARHRSVLAGSV